MRNEEDYIIYYISVVCGIAVAYMFAEAILS